jgi:hypothetical protein
VRLEISELQRADPADDDNEHRIGPKGLR